MKSVTSVATAAVFGFGVVAAMLAAEPVKPEAGDEGMLVARPLKFKPEKPDFWFRLGGKGKLTILESAAAVEDLVGKKTGKQLVSLVDFAKEKIVLVSWFTGGPPDGVLKHETKGEGKDRQLVFYIQGPPREQRRGKRLRVGADFFGVPKDAAVSFERKERF